MISLFASALGRHRRRAAPNSLAVDHRVLDEPQFHWLLGCLAQCHGLDVDARLLRHHMPPPFDVGSLVRLAAELGLEAAPVEVSDLVSQPAAFPLVAFYRADAPETVAQVAVILGREGDRLLYLAPGMDAPGTLAAQAFHVVFERVALGTRGALDDAPAADAEGADARAVARFGFRWFLPELANHRRIWRDVLLASGAIQLAALATPLFTQVIIDKVVVHHTQSTLVVVVAGMAMFLLFSSAMNWARQYLVAHTGTRIDAALGSRVFGHLVRLPASYFERRPTGTIVSRLQAVETIREFLTGAAVTLLLDVPFLAVFLAIMAWYSPMLTSIAVVALALLAALSAWVTPMLRGRLDEQFLAGARSQALVTEFVAGMPTVKALQMESVVARRYDDALARHLAAGLRTRRLANAYQVGAGTIEQFMTVTILATGAWLVMHDRGFTVGMLVAFQMFASRMTQPVLRIVGLWQQMQQAAVAVKRLGELMDAPEEIYRLRPARAPASRGVVNLEGVGFRYSERHPFLFRNLDLTLPHGRVTLLTGPSGIGKSTLTRLLLGFERPTEGRILVDDRDSRHLAANELRALFGVVPQDTVLFADTIRVNLWLAAPAATFADIVLACRLAGVHDAIERMPDGYDTRLGERGSGLSGGQRQRIAIARALLRRPKLLVFDEATSHLDADTAQALVQTVNALRGQATILFVAHAVPPGLVVDQVVRMSEDGVRTIVSAVTGDGRGVPPAGVPGAVPA